jgi:heptosyltransferase III
MKKPENILIVRTDRIGDVVLSLPLAPVIKKVYPDCRITFLMRDYTKALAEGNPYIDEILLLKMKGNKPDLIANVKEIHSRKFDTVIIVYPFFIISLILFLSGIKIRIGTGYRWYSILFNKKVYEHRKYADKHELEYNLALLNHLGIPAEQRAEKPEFSLQIDPFALKRVAAVLKEKNVNPEKNIIIVHPGSGGSAIDLPLGKFKELVTMISSSTNSEIIITGSRDETDKCEYISEGTANNLAGYFDLAELTALISFASIFISNSTGPLHIAAALGKHIIGFYPKIQACSVRRWGPYTEKGYVFVPEIDCTNCTVEQCHKLKCMNSIDINKVFDKIQKILMLLPNTGEIDAK